jgi:uncharacterized protein YjbI with pentapeptide repeats
MKPKIPSRNIRRTPVRLVAVILGIAGIFIGIGKELIAGIGLVQAILNFFLNIGNDLFGIAITVLVIDLLNEKNEEYYQKEKLIRELASKDNGIALRALMDLDARGWLSDGTLMNAILIEANLIGIGLNNAKLPYVSLEKANMKDASLSKTDLSNANLIDVNLQNCFMQEINLENANLWRSNLSSTILERVNLRNATLWQVNFQGAFINDCDLHNTDMRSSNLKEVSISNSDSFKTANRICGAIMPDGQRYNGSYNLSGDLEDAKKRGIDIKDSKSMAAFYGVSLDDYVTGQGLTKQ